MAADPSPGFDLLLVEDDPAIALMYRVQLEAAGHAVTLAADGSEGVRLAHELQPQLILLDLRLPRLDGFGVLEAVRGHPATAAIPIVILSNYDEHEMVERGLTLGALEYLIKSQVTPAQLAERVPGWARRTPAPAQ